MNDSDKSSKVLMMEKVSLIVRLSRPRTWMFAIVSYLFAYIQSNNLILWQLVAGSAICSLLTAATNMINAFTDIQEDRIISPIRVTWIERLSVKNLVNTIIGIYLLVFFLSLSFGPVFMSIVTIAVFNSIFYSLPPLRFKRHPVTALISFSGAAGLPFLAGLAAINRLSLTDPWFILFTVFMLAYGTVKNVPDFLGDNLAGLKTTAMMFSLKRAVIVSTIILFLPYLLLIFFIGMGKLNELYLLNILLMSFPVYWAYRSLKADKREALEKLHTLGFVYAVSFFLINIVLSNLSLISIAIAFSVMFLTFLLTNLNIDSRVLKLRAKDRLHDELD